MKIGIDIIEIERFVSIENNVKKLKKIFLDEEIAYFNKFEEKSNHIAGFFCVKEALSKALGIGFGKLLSPVDIKILHDDKGKPFIDCSNNKLKNLLDNKKIEVSISHSKTHATAICLIYD